MEKIMVILMGIPGSGKSTFYRKHLAGNFLHVNLDTLKTRHQERLLIQQCFEQGQNFVIDNTNPAKADRLRYIPDAKEAGYRIVGYFMESKLQSCIERNNQRSGSAKIPAKAIAAISNKLQMPSYDEGFDAIYFVKNNGKTMTIEDWRE